MKTNKCLSLLLIFIFSMIPTSPYAESPQTKTQIDLENIDLEIDLLNKHLAKLRKKALNDEMNAQPYMFDYWKEFSNKIEQAEIREKNILEIKEKIKKLKAKKSSLIKQSP